MKIEKRYLDGSYLNLNPEWDQQDSEWKADLVKTMLLKHKLSPLTLCEVGCGAGGILKNLKISYPQTIMHGYDVAPSLLKFWPNEDESDIKFTLGNFYQKNTIIYEMLLMLDVFEHVRDPFTFLEETKKHSKKFIFHIPLDLSALSVARGYPLIRARKMVGHLNFYDKNIALETLTDCGYKIIDWKYTRASQTMPNRKLKTKLAGLSKGILSYINRDLSVRILGGDTLIVLAE